MTPDETLPRFRGIRRFRNPVEFRYRTYERPEKIDAICEKCGSPYVFKATPTPTEQFDPETGGYEVLKGKVCGNFEGKGACQKCGRVSRSINWPDDALLKLEIPGGLFWVWNYELLPVMRARIAGDNLELRNLIGNDWKIARIVGRIPKFATIKKNRPRILKEIDHWLSQKK
ncbi:hypothetical protein Pcar_0533 [Syntrophotalea carbinolica DSM 2380]|uniref:Uncharacterized protein n=1 Tax=Syntrophotalea carbinolica (strain DSM 2380 / NBRC 103641 / GraBd1) TaxID=338963 RepID=Q3A754_SYNC1|nr:hypothetical protein [Syntrophotalea carbinolica]ABA87793.1 hypothetical protein Pcar_0533 [Syntrophotalea carbinolica DSM 2380]